MDTKNLVGNDIGATLLSNHLCTYKHWVLTTIVDLFP